MWFIHLNMENLPLSEQIVTIKAAEGCFTKLDNVYESGLEYVTGCAVKATQVCMCSTHTHARVFKLVHLPTGILLTEAFGKIYPTLSRR